MLNQNNNALGVIFPNSYDNLVPELVNVRTVASIPFAGRYRLIDFMLSSMSNCGISNISLLVRKNYHSLMDHIDSGREWDLVRKNGGLNIFPPYAEKEVKVYNGRVEALASILPFLKSQKEKYVVMADANLAVSFDFNALIDEHIKSGADVTLCYQQTEIPEGAKEDNYTLDVDENGKVNQILVNSDADGVQNLSMFICVVDRVRLCEMVKEASVRGQQYFERDLLAKNMDKLNIHAMNYKGYVARVTDVKSYFDENMKLLDKKNVAALFNKNNPIYTKVRDDNPTYYHNGSKVTNAMLADGCDIYGEVESSVLFRGVVVEAGAVVRNCVLMQDTVVKAGATVEYVVTDKKVTITENKILKGTDSFPIYVSKNNIV